MNYEHPYLWVVGSLILAIISLVSSLIYAWLSLRLSRFETIEEENRNVRKEIYKKFYFTILEMADSKGSDPKDMFFQSFNSMLFFAPDSLLRAVIDWKNDSDKNNGQSKINSPKLTKILDEMRKDLKLSKSETITKVGFVPVGRNILNKK